MAVDDDGRTIVREETRVVPRRRWRAWVAGFVTALVVVVVAVGVYLAVSDDDDDGSVDVPTVDVQVDE